MNEATWDGICKPEALTTEGNRLRQMLAENAKFGKWSTVLKLLEENHFLINSVRPGGISFYAPLHQAAYGSAPLEVIDELLRLGAWRTLQTAFGERPVDIAEKKKNFQLIERLTPVMHRQIPWGILLKIQTHFHAVIYDRIHEQIDVNSLRLPEMEPLLEFEEHSHKFWFPVPGMYGGFAYWFERDGTDPLLITESWSRISAGSGQRHEIRASGSSLVAKGFV